MRNKSILLNVGFVLALAFIVFVVIFDANRTNDPVKGKIKVVAAENFWGSLVSQIGGKDVNVLSIVSDPNADPHEYESNTKDARAVANANYVIVNGVGYDSWANKLISATNDPTQKVLNVGNLLGKKNGDNPHLWYNPSYVNKTATIMEENLSALEPSDANYFSTQLKNLQTSLASYQNRINEIKKQYKGTKVAATEDIFAYLAQAAGLDLVSPQAFIQAVAEGNDPPASSIVTFQQQLESGQVKVLVYNEQTVTPLTTTMKQLAAQENIPVVGVTETIQPPNESFQVWMNAEILNLENALNANALGQ